MVLLSGVAFEATVFLTWMLAAAQPYLLAARAFAVGKVAVQLTDMTRVKLMMVALGLMATIGAAFARTLVVLALPTATALSTGGSLDYAAPQGVYWQAAIGAALAQTLVLLLWPFVMRFVTVDVDDTHTVFQPVQHPLAIVPLALATAAGVVELSMVALLTNPYGVHMASSTDYVLANWTPFALLVPHQVIIASYTTTLVLTLCLR